MATATGFEPASSRSTSGRSPRLSHTANGFDADVVRGGFEPPASAVSERRSQPTELPDTSAPCGTRTRSPTLKGQETNPYPNGTLPIWTWRFVGESNSCCLAENQVCCRYTNEPCAASSGLEPELPGTKIRWASDYPTRHRWCVRRDSNPRAQRKLVYSQPRQALFASHAWHLTDASRAGLEPTVTD